MRVVLAGASGLIGTALATELRAHGHEVATLVRHATSEPGSSQWDPGRGQIDAGFLAGAEAVVCLSGAGVAEHRWTDDYKRTILASRVDSVGTLARVLAEHDDAPRVLVAGSAVGYYGDTGDVTVTESSPAGDTFLAGVCQQWEAAAEPARQSGLRVAHLRTGLVLAAEADLVKRLKLVTSLGVAGRLGSGRQFMPWVTLLDEVRAIEHLLTANVSGPVNLTAPNPVRNADFMSTLGTILHRPTVLPTPGFALRLVLGEFAEDTLTGQRALPDVLLGSGFEFRHADVEAALRWALGR